MPLRLSVPPMLLFWGASLTPLVLLAVGSVAGGAWLVAALVWITLLAAVLDQMPPILCPDLPEGAEFSAGDRLLVVLGLAQLALLPVAVPAVAGVGGLGGSDRAVAFVAAGLISGQIGMPVAHELIHRSDRRLYCLGVAIHVALLFGHHASAHRLIHHVRVGTPGDPNTARRGETLYRFVPRAWVGSFRAGLAAEMARRPRRLLHPYAIYLGGSAAGLAIASGLAGPAGVAVWAALGLWASVQLLMSDYVQHYGLCRAIGTDGRPEPVGLQHSWNAPHWFSAALMLNAPRHSDHHAHPGRPYPALRLTDAAPMLPYPLPMMAVIALVPRLWQRVMHPRLAALSARSRERSRESDAGGLGRGGSDLAS